MEFKAAKDADEEKLQDLAGKALEQIDIRKYDIEFTARNIRTCVKYGIVFSGKNVAVKMK